MTEYSYFLHIFFRNMTSIASSIALSFFLSGCKESKPNSSQEQGFGRNDLFFSNKDREKICSQTESKTNEKLCNWMADPMNWARVEKFISTRLKRKDNLCAAYISASLSRHDFGGGFKGLGVIPQFVEGTVSLYDGLRNAGWVEVACSNLKPGDVVFTHFYDDNAKLSNEKFGHTYLFIQWKNTKNSNPGSRNQVWAQVIDNQSLAQTPDGFRALPIHDRYIYTKNSKAVEMGPGETWACKTALRQRAGR